jgi:hypothetical protein
VKRLILAAALLVTLVACGGDPAHNRPDPNAGAPIDPHDSLNYDCAPPGPHGTLNDGIDTFTNGGSSAVTFSGRAWLRDPKNIRLIRVGFVAGPDSFTYGLGYIWPKSAVPVTGYRLQPGKQVSLILQVALGSGKSGYGVSPGAELRYISGDIRYTYHSPIAVAIQKGNCTH